MCSMCMNVPIPPPPVPHNCVYSVVECVGLRGGSNRTLCLIFAYVCVCVRACLCMLVCV